MKYLLILIVIGVIAFLIGARRAARPQQSGPAPKPPQAPTPPKTMVACAYCGMHLPQDEALPGRGGVFCGAAHRSAHEAEAGG